MLSSLEYIKLFYDEIEYKMQILKKNCFEINIINGCLKIRRI